MTALSKSAEERLRVSGAYRALMLKEDGTLKDDAEIVLRDLEKACGWMSDSLPVGTDNHVDPYRAVASTARRGVFAHIKKRLFEPLGKYRKQTEIMTDGQEETG